MLTEKSCKFKSGLVAIETKLGYSLTGKKKKHNESLKNSTAKMLKRHKGEKIEIAQDCQNRFPETHQNVITKSKELTSKADSEMKVTCYN